MRSPRPHAVAAFLLVASLGPCRDDTPQALGTLEYDRITLPAPAAERIVSIDVREGQRVKAGQSLLRLELDRTRSAAEASRMQAAGQLNPDLDPRLLVTSLIGLTLFPAAGAPIWRRLFDADDIDAAAMKHHAIALLDAGIGVP